METWSAALRQHEIEMSGEYAHTFDEEPTMTEKLAHLDRLAVSGTISAPKRVRVRAVTIMVGAVVATALTIWLALVVTP